MEETNDSERIDPASQLNNINKYKTKLCSFAMSEERLSVNKIRELVLQMSSLPLRSSEMREK